MPKKSTHHTSHHLRVIGGKYRSRKIKFAADIAVRPTPNRTRETLFNWLQPSIQDAKCLELYGGSGIISIEALSRGADHITIVEQSAPIHEQIKRNLEDICPDPTRYLCVHANALHWINQHCNQQWDLVFLDPPFDSNELSRLLPMLATHKMLAEDGLIYIESAQPTTPAQLPENWQIIRQKKAASVHYCLVRSSGS
ncbi:MAG: 16S rRNA (guanine(966)-N(2))-methyltransferase RsmD [Pseudomonadales bacterium]|nr:16S rRNA (guanine(966)-N(2))-methyltransferase RsmD [Pseudomonadales bacterium]